MEKELELVVGIRESEFQRIIRLIEATRPYELENKVTGQKEFKCSGCGNVIPVDLDRLTSNHKEDCIWWQAMEVYAAIGIRFAFKSVPEGY